MAINKLGLGMILVSTFLLFNGWILIMMLFVNVPLGAWIFKGVMDGLAVLILYPELKDTIPKMVNPRK